MTHAFATALLAVATALAGAPAAAQSVADFYKGETINFIAGFGPGGGYNLYPRVPATPL